jgi:hypothetical protein
MHCHDGEEWVHPNWYELDGTVDYSEWTSIHTDGQDHTSPSFNVRSAATSNIENYSETSVEKIIPRVQLCGNNLNIAKG